MGVLAIISIAGVVAVLAIASWTKNFDFPEQSLDLVAWWGPNVSKHINDTSVRPFRITFDEKTLEVLKFHLKQNRSTTPPLEGSAFEYGFNSNQLDSWLEYWREEYPFKKREDFLNQYPQFKTNIQGLDIHFIRVKPKANVNKELVPLLLLHGWPGSVREFYETIPYLTAIDEGRDFAVEVIIPSLPGFGFSDAAVRPGLGGTEMAVVMRNLMRRLGYKKYYIQGGDWGAYVTMAMATLFPKEVLGYHTNLAVALTPQALIYTLLGAILPSYVVEPHLANRMYPLSEHLKFYLIEFGYLHIQATKPDTIGIAVSDSPGGLLAYVLQLFSSGTRRSYVYREDGGLELLYTRDQLIDNLMMYYVSNSMTTSARIYAETVNLRTLRLGVLQKPTPVPTCVLQAKDEIIYQSPTILKTKYPNLVNATVLDDGGHFLALEKPEVFATNILDAIRDLRRWYVENPRKICEENNCETNSRSCLLCGFN